MSRKRIHVIRFEPKQRCTIDRKKRCYIDKIAADLVLQKIVTTHSDRQNHPKRSYKCKCGYWHLTSKP